MAQLSAKSTMCDANRIGNVELLQHASDSENLLLHVGPARTYGLYLHIPFCFHKCHYCDFYSIVDDKDRQKSFTHRMIEEIGALAPFIQGPIRTIFVGGGTPTLLKPELWRDLLDALTTHVDLAQLQEFTVEANPETLTPELLEVLRAGGVNRLSIGAQSFQPGHLKTLERWHDPANVVRSVDLARQVGIDNLNLDLIFGIPGQSMEAWREDLRQALVLEPTHLSCYGLTYEPNTALTKKLHLNRIQPCDEQLEAAMFRITRTELNTAGFEQYEISNFARPGRRCLHNLGYWQNENWLALGPSASGHVNGVRWKNQPHLGKYLATRRGAPIQDVECLDPDASVGEQLMVRLRLLEGIPRAWLDAHLDPRRARVVQRLVEEQLLVWTPSHLKLTERGLMIADSVMAELL